jgi:hypothetical protein
MPGNLTTSVTQTLQTTSTLMKQVGTQLQNAVFDKQYDLGNFVTNVSILPAIPSVVVQFLAQGMKPNTKVYAYFGDVPVTAHCALSYDGYSLDSIEASQKCAAYGTGLVTDNFGSCKGIFKIPPGKFKSQEITFKLLDIANLEQGESAITTAADGVYYGSTLSIAKGGSKFNTRQTVLSSTTVDQQKTVEGLAIGTSETQSYVEDPPPGRGGSGCGCGSIICTKLYQMGLMDEETYKADEAYGEMLRTSSPETYEGYLRWASIVVEWMSGNTPNMFIWIRDKKTRKEKELEFIIRVTHRIATPWAEHMQFVMGRKEKDNKVGKLIMNVGAPISRWINKFSKFENNKTTQYSMLGIFYVLYNISKMFGGKFGFPKPINI